MTLLKCGLNLIFVKNDGTPPLEAKNYFKKEISKMKTKKILSVLLAVVMALSCMTVMASAYLAPDRNPEVGQNLPLVPQEIHPDLSTYVETAVDYGNLSPEAAKDIADRLVKAIDPAVAGQLTGIIDGIFTNANLGKLMHMLWTALSGMGTFAPKPSGYASIAYYKPGTEDTAKYEKALAVIKATSNDWSDFAGFQNGDCGFNDGDIDGFVDAFAAMMRPLSFALIALKIGNYNEKVDGQYHYTYGMYDAFLPLFEILELDNVVSSVDMIDNGANYISTDGTFVQFLKPIAGLIKDVKAAPAATIIDLLPKLAYAVESGILDTAFSKSMTWLGPVFSLIGLSYPDNLSLTAEGIWDTIIAADLDNDAETATLAEQIADMDITLTKDFFVKTIKALARLRQGC